MGVGRQRRALPGLEIHHIVADRAAAQRQAGLSRFAQQRQIDAKAAVGGLGPRDRLEHQIDRRALPDQSERGGDMGEHAALRRYLQPRDDAVEQARRDHLLGAVGRNAGEAIAGTRRRRLGEQVAQIIEHIGGGIDGLAIDLMAPGPSTLHCARLPAYHRSPGAIVPGRRLEIAFNRKWCSGMPDARYGRSRTPEFADLRSAQIIPTN